MGPRHRCTAASSLLLLLTSAAATIPQGWIQQEPEVTPHDATTSSWARLRRAESEQQVRLTVVLRVEPVPLAALERTLLEVSDPDHQRYGQHLSQQEVTDLLAMPPGRVEAVEGYFLESGASSVVTAPNRDMLTVTMPVRNAESALSTELHVFQHTEHSRAQIVRAGTPYFLPPHVAEHVTMVGELLQFPRLPAKKLFSLVGAGAAAWPNSCDASACANLVTPSVLAQRYKFPEPTGVTTQDTKNSMSVAEFQGQFWQKADLDAFGKGCHRNVTVDVTVGEEEPEGGIESELDIEYIKAIAPEIPLTVIYNTQYSLLNWANEINSIKPAPLVHSVSYGNDEKQQSSADYIQACNRAFMKAGARGMSILFASGDQGVCGREGCGLGTRRHFHPDFPAASPYITAVGGTDFAVPGTIGDETTWESGGGGFSDNFAIPSWQADAVAAYKANPDAKLPPQTMWNNTGRGYPDVAALGGEQNPYCINVGGQFQGVAGTSASSPVVAGIFAKLNGLRLSKGMSPLGFLNPFIYKNPSCFQDVTSGINDDDVGYGFTATKGWDAATGWGTPDFQALSAAVMRAPAAQETSLIV